jgi:hypothetical protein
MFHKIFMLAVHSGFSAFIAANSADGQEQLHSAFGAVLFLFC